MLTMQSNASNNPNEPEYEPEMVADAPPAEEVETEFASAEEQILALQAEVTAQKDRALRALAEAENTRRRAVREREEASRFGTMEMAREMLGVADNFSMALGAVTDDMRKDEKFGALVAGIEMTARQLQQSLEKFGVRQFDPKGLQFDPNVHDVFMEVENTGHTAGTIVNVLQAGYTIHDRLLRPARVAVAKGQVEATKVDTKV
jgi:molecular chaperone GrpE